VPRARPEDPLSGCPSADPSPKKQKTCAAPISPQGSSRSKRSRLEEQLACSTAELRYIDSQSPENQQVSLIQPLYFVYVVTLWFYIKFWNNIVSKYGTVSNLYLVGGLFDSQMRSWLF
jgi:hypothetical protein